MTRAKAITVRGNNGPNETITLSSSADISSANLRNDANTYFIVIDIPLVSVHLSPNYSQPKGSLNYTVRVPASDFDVGFQNLQRVADEVRALGLDPVILEASGALLVQATTEQLPSLKNIAGVSKIIPNENLAR